MMVRTELFFGTRRADGPEVSDWQWRQFVNEELTPRFPQGLTILSGDGQWREESGETTREHAWLVIIVHELGADADRKIDEVRQIYKQRFNQRSVMRTESRESVSF